MPTAISTRPPIPIQASLSYTTLPSSATRFNVKLAPTISSATVISFEKRADQKIWYIVKIQPQSQLYNKSRSYVIARKYEDFAQLSQSLHERFNTSKKHRAGSRLPPKIKNRLNILPASKQLHAQRAEEINQFLNVLFQTQSIITESYIVLEFFGIQKADLVYYEKPSTMILPENASSRWKRLRCTSFLARSSPSTTALSSLCSQAANKIIPPWNRSNNSPQPSLSTPSITRSYGSTKEGLLIKKSKSSTSVSVMPSPTSSSSSNTVRDTIKIKVIYNVDNIIVIQVPRTITLHELRSRIAQKFSDQSMDEVVLLFNDSMSSCCSISSTSMALPAVLIRKEQDLAQLFSTKWNRLEKVTLRCII